MGRLAALPALLKAAILPAAAVALPVVVLLLASCGGSAPPPAQTPAAPATASAAQPSASARPAVVISDRDGPSWSGKLGDTVQIDWYDQTSGEPVSEQVAVLAVKRLPSPDDDEPPAVYGGGYGPYEWKYAIKVRLTSLDARSARQPLAYQFLQLSDGRASEDGVSGLGRPGGPDPSRPGRSSAGWLRQWTEQGFKPTRVTMRIGAWSATWYLRR